MEIDDMESQVGYPHAPHYHTLLHSLHSTHSTPHTPFHTLHSTLHSASRSSFPSSAHHLCAVPPALSPPALSPRALTHPSSNTPHRHPLQSISFSVNGQPKVRGGARIAAQVRPWALAWNKHDTISLSHLPSTTTGASSAAAAATGAAASANARDRQATPGASGVPPSANTASASTSAAPRGAADKQSNEASKGGGKGALPPITTQQSMTPHKYDCFLTHDWGTDDLQRDNHQRVLRVNKALQQAGFSTWFDEDRLEGDIVQQMCDGIDQSMCVLVFITQNYITKVSGTGPKGATDNCKREFGYSWRRKGVEFMHACVMEKRCSDPSTWRGGVGMNLGGKLYTTLWDDDDRAFREAIADIIDNIQSMRKRVPVPRSLGQPHPVSYQKSVSSVQPKDVGMRHSIDLIKKDLGLPANSTTHEVVSQGMRRCGLLQSEKDTLPEQVRARRRHRLRGRLTLTLRLRARAREVGLETGRHAA